MRALLIACLFASTALAQTGNLGLFTNAADIGAPPLKGSAEYDAAARTYKITGTGTDIWGKADQFHYVWREMSGNFSVSATTKFLTDGIAHRKAVDHAAQDGRRRLAVRPPRHSRRRHGGRAIQNRCRAATPTPSIFRSGRQASGN